MESFSIKLSHCKSYIKLKPIFFTLYAAKKITTVTLLLSEIKNKILLLNLKDTKAFQEPHLHRVKLYTSAWPRLLKLIKFKHLMFYFITAARKLLD